MNFLEGLLLVKLPEGLIGNGIILMGSSGWQLVSSNPATGNQTMFVAAAPDDQVRLKKGVHRKKATEQGSAKPFLFDSVNLEPIAHSSRKNRRYADCHKVAAWGFYRIAAHSPEFSGRYPDCHDRAVNVKLTSKK
jgi:hypothetical protein